MRFDLGYVGSRAAETAVGTAAIVGAPTDVVDMETAKATVVALVSTVVYRLVLKGVGWLWTRFQRK